MEVGYVLQPDEIPSLVLKEKRAMFKEFGKERFGVLTFWTCYPVYDDENPTEVIATFGVVTPKVMANELREMAELMDGGVVGIAAAIEELAASASSIHESERALYEEVQDITKLTNEINNIGDFIKKIAGETNMPGLNASIEAATQEISASIEQLSTMSEELYKVSMEL